MKIGFYHPPIVITGACYPPGFTVARLKLQASLKTLEPLTFSSFFLSLAVSKRGRRSHNQPVGVPRLSRGQEQDEVGGAVADAG